jgi:hypothetical protein
VDAAGAAVPNKGKGKASNVLNGNEQRDGRQCEPHLLFID